MVLSLHSKPWSCFYKPTVPQIPPSHFQDFSTSKNASLELPTVVLYYKSSYPFSGPN